jgi:hypothetical protein
MGIPIDIKGQRFGRLVAMEKHHQGIQGRWYWLCKCNCGNSVVVLGTQLRNGNTKSCGCLKSEAVIQRNKDNSTHNLSKHPAYNIHSNMINRCYDTNNPRYKDYGGRGIAVCEEWKDITTFCNWMMNNNYVKGLSIERIDNNGNYEPSNCILIPLENQSKNRRSNHSITYNGSSNTIAEWSRITGINMYTLFDRLYRGWTDEEIVATPVGVNKEKYFKKEE